MTKNIKLLEILFMFVWTLTVDAHYYNNVRVNDTPVRCLAQTDNELIWLGTGNGLYCYDGYRAIPKHGLSNSMRTTIYSMLSNGNLLYLGTSNGFYIYNTITGIYDQPVQLRKEVRALEKINQNILLGLNDGLWEYNTLSRQLRLLCSSIRDIYSLLYVDGIVYIGTLKGLFAYSNGKSVELKLNNHETSLVFSLLSDRQRRCIWVGTGNMLYQYSLTDGNVKKLAEMNDVSVKAMSLTDNHSLCAATDNGFYTYTEAALSLDKHDAQNPHSIADNVVWSTMTDRKGNLILGTDIGISVVNVHPYYNYNPICQLTGHNEGNKFSVIFVDSKGRKWLGGSNGLILIDKGCHRWYRQADRQYPISHNRIRRVYEDLTGNIWIATDNGINHYDEATGKMRSIVISDKSDKHNARWAYDLIDDGSGRLWVAAYSGGIFIVSKEKLLACREYVIADNHLDCSKGGLSFLWVRQLAKDSNGHIWARTDKGLDRINIASLKVDNMAKSATGCMSADKYGNIWTANTNELLCYGKSGKTQSHSYGSMQENVETVMLCEINDQIWAITNEECLIFSVNDGHKLRRLHIPIINAYGAFYSSDYRRLYIGGQDGIVELFPSEIGSRNKKRELMLTDFYVNGKQRHVNGNTIRLKYNENNIDLRLTDLPYTGEVTKSYAYQLKGIDDKWHLIRSIEEPLVYRALPHGSYTLTIRSIDTDVNNGSEVFLIHIRILPPWYLSWWAKTLYLLLFVASILWLSRFYLMRKQLAKEKRDKQLIIEQSRARMDFYNNMSHSLKQELHKVMAPASDIMENKDGKYTRIMSLIRSQTTRINCLIRQAFDMGDIVEPSQELQLTRINAVRFCKETIEGLRQETDKRKVRYIFLTDKENIFMQTDVMRFDSVLSILLLNIIKSVDYPIEIRVEMSQNEVRQKVQILLHCRNLDLSGSAKPFDFQHYQVKTNIEELGGKISIGSAKDGGTNFIMTFDTMPVESKELTHNTSEEHKVKVTIEMNEKDEKWLREITIIIEQNLVDSDFNVTKLQEATGFGQKLLYRKIKQLTGVSPVEYIRNIRMEKARLLLREGKFSISEVMYMVGFTKSGYFSKCFQEAYGMTPSAYIKNTSH